ncbi:MAG: T9SS type A sorting domain-containing protein, partial [Bacteroidota bacterium]
FFNFGTDGATAGEQTYYWDEVKFGEDTMVSISGLLEAGLKCYPNPVANQMTVAFEKNIESISVWTLQGQLLMEKKVQATQGSFDTSHLPAGTYLLRVQAEGQVGSYRFLKY